MTIANKKELTTDKEYTGYVKVTRIYCLGFESPNDAQAVIDLKTIIPTEIFNENFDEQTNVTYFMLWLYEIQTWE